MLAANKFVYCIMQTIWKEIKGFEGRYNINTSGDIMTLSVKSNKHDGMKTHKLSRHGYKIVQLYIGRKTHTRSIHRLLAETFIPNPLSKRCVNHINGIKHDNRLENLEWVTDKENVSHAISLGLR